MELDAVFDFKALNYPPYLTYDANSEDLAVDPGDISSLWDTGFQAELLKIYPDNDSFIREVAKYNASDKANVQELKKALVLHLMQNWKFISSFQADHYAGNAGNFVSWGKFFDVSANQELRAVLITQTAQGAQSMTNITIADAGYLPQDDIPKPVKGVKRVARGKREHPPPKRSERVRYEAKPRSWFEPEIRGVLKKVITKMKYGFQGRDTETGAEGRELIGGDNIQRGENETVEDTRLTRAGPSSSHSLALTARPSPPSGSTPEVSSFAGFEAGGRYFFLAPKTFEDPPADKAVEVTDVGFSNLLGWLRLPTLVLTERPVTPSPTETVQCVVDASDELADWLGVFFGTRKKQLSLMAEASAATVTGLSFKTDLAATMSSKAREVLPSSSPLHTDLDFNTALSPVALGTTPFQGPQIGDTSNAAPLTVGNMLVFGLAPVNDTWLLTMADICTLLEFDNTTIILSSLAEEQWAIDIEPGVPSRNATWFIPDSFYTTVLRLQFVHLDSPQTRETWLESLLNKFADFAKVTLMKPVQLIVRKIWTLEHLSDDAYAVGSEWELTLRCTVSIRNRVGDELEFVATIIFKSTQTQLLLALKDSQSHAGDIGKICDFLTGFLPLETPVPSIKDYIPAASDIFFRRVLLTLGKGGKTAVELVFEIRLSSSSFLVTLILGSEPQFSGTLFDTLSPKDVADAVLFPYYEEHLQLLPIAQVDMTQPLDLGGLYQSVANSSLTTKPPFGLQLVTASLTVNQSVISLQGAVTDLSDPETNPTTSTLPRIDLDLATLCFEYRFATKSVRINAGVNLSLTPRTTTRDLGSVQVGIMVEYDAGDWVLQGSLLNLSFAHLYRFFDSDNNEEIMDILEQVKIRLFQVEYRYRSGGKGNSIDLTGIMGLGSLDLGFSYHSEGAGNWDLNASLQSSSTSSNGSLLGIISEFCGESVTTQLPACLVNIPLQGDQAAIELSLGQHDDYFILVNEIHVTSTTTVMFLHMVQKRGTTQDSARAVPKRVLLLSVAPIAVTSSQKPFISALTQPFDDLEFVWVQDANKSKGLTKSEVDILNTRLAGKHAINYKETATKSTPTQPNDVVLKAGCHFLVVSGGSVILDYVFDGNKQKKSDSAYQAEEANAETDVQSSKTAPLKKQIGPISISDIGLGFSKNTLSIILTATSQLGSFNVDLVGLTIHVMMGQDGNLLNLKNAEIGLSLSGIGLGLNTPTLSMAGMLVDKSTPPKEGQPGLEDYFGGAGVSFKPYSLLGVGRYSKSSSGFVSLFAYAQLNGPLAQLGAVQISGVKAGVGYNTAIRKPDLSNIPSFPFCAVTQSSFDLVTSQDGLLRSDLISVQADKDPLMFLDTFIRGGWFSPSDGNTWVAMGMEVSPVVICASIPC
ncbi:hypothetical protein FOXYSP1_11610 [Fusarium oxysporum f. sp. phaseoli]